MSTTSVFLEDPSGHFQRVLLAGREYDLVVLHVLTFALLDMVYENTFVRCAPRRQHARRPLASALTPRVFPSGGRLCHLHARPGRAARAAPARCPQRREEELDRRALLAVTRVPILCRWSLALVMRPRALCGAAAAAPETTLRGAALAQPRAAPALASQGSRFGLRPCRLCARN